MKFIHIADLHLDTPLVALKNNRELVKKRRMEQKKAFKDVILLAKEENVDFIFIAGDFFEQKFVEKNTIEYIIKTIELIPNIEVFIAPGNHDPLIKNSPYKTYKWPGNVIIFDENISKISFEFVDIYGFGFEDYEMSSNKLEGFRVENPDKVNVLFTHGTLCGNSKYNDINYNDLKQFDYVALGHIHAKKLDDNVVYPGAFMACGFDEPGEHGFVIGNLEKGNISYEFRNIEERHFETIELDISEIRSANEIAELLKLKNDIYRIKLTGIRNVEFRELKDEIASLDGLICNVIDNTHLPYNLEEIASMKNLKGIFTKKMLEVINDMPENEEEIMKAIEITYSFL